MLGNPFEERHLECQKEILDNSLMPHVPERICKCNCWDIMALAGINI